MGKKLEFLRKYQESNPEKFNDNLINCKENHKDMTILLDEILKTFENIENIKYLGLKVVPMNFSDNIDDEEYKNTKPNKDKEEFKIDIEGSRLIKVIAKFHIKAKSRTTSKDSNEIKESIVEVPLYLPELLDAGYYIISGCKYYPIFQIVDAECYRTRSSITLKTMNQPLVINFENTTLKDVSGEVDYGTKDIFIRIFKQRISPLYYLFSKFGGVDKTLEFFRINEFVSIKETQDDSENNYYFELNSKNIFIEVKKNFLNNENTKDNALIIKLFQSMLNDIIGSKKLSLETINDETYWKKKLGGVFTKNSNSILLKNERILLSLERICDPTTQRLMRISEEDKKDIYSIIRWVILNFNELLKLDNTDLSNKRVRIHEYQLYDFIENNSKGIYRINYSSEVTFEKLESLFSNIQIGRIIRSITTNDLVRYNGAVNTIDLFGSKLKGTNTGPQTQTNTGGGMNIRNRGIFQSYIGKIDLCTTSTNDPGSSFTLVPFFDIKENLHFTDKMGVNIKDFNDIDFTKSREDN